MNVEGKRFLSPAGQAGSNWPRYMPLRRAACDYRATGGCGRCGCGTAAYGR